MINPYFSIILPVYNAKKYLSNTIESILDQTFQDFELILIDDGSTDGSSEICTSYRRIDKRIIYKRQNNQGISNARNQGIRLSNGKYIAFCDHDDEYDSNLLNIAYEKLHDSEFDVFKFSYQNIVYLGEQKVKKYYIRSYDYQGETSILKKDYVLFNIYSFTVWNGIYRREYLINKEECFDTNIKFGMEDVLFNINLFNKLTKILILDVVLYKHYIRYGQSTSRKFDQNKIDSIYLGLKKEKELLSDTLDSKGKIFLYGKYIRAFFSTLGLSDNNYKHSEKNDQIKKFKQILSIDLKIKDYLISFKKQKKDIIKILLFKIHCYQILFYLTKRQ